MKCYIAGPITGDPNYKQKFDAVAEKLKELGLEPVNPADAPEGLSYKEYIDRGLKQLMECEIICILPGSVQTVTYRNVVHKGSKGAGLEAHYARTVGMYYLEAYQDKSKEWQIRAPACWENMFKGESTMKEVEK